MRLFLTLTFSVLLFISRAGGQVIEPTEDAPTAAPDAQAAVTTGVGTGEVQLRVQTVGLGGYARAGGWTGVQVEVLDSGGKVRDVLIRTTVSDADGDLTWVQRAITTNPGNRQSVWLYLRLPSWFSSTDQLPVSAFEAIVTGKNEPGKPREFRPGKLLGSTRHTLNTDPYPNRSMIAVVGAWGGGIEQYEWPTDRSRRVSISGHESFEIARGLTVANLPDRWIGLETFDALFWTGNDPVQHQPAQLKAGQPEAIREWVQRGGHLVIVLPTVGQTWFDSAGENGGADSGGVLLSDILPRVKVRRQEGVSLEAYRSLLTRDRRVALPEKSVVQSFEADAAGPFEAMPIMTGPGGEVLVVRRLVGAGAVTAIGLDILNPKLRENWYMLQADHFWHRVLGERFACPPPKLMDEDMKGGPTGKDQSLWVVSRADATFDGRIAAMIAKSGAAAVGVLLGLVVFGLYWLFAGPLGYFILRGKGKVQHAWVAFTLAIVVFTAVAWGGANFMKTRRVEAKHLTFLDAVYGQPTVRARTFASVFLPSYGEQKLSVTSGSDQVINTITPWEPAPESGGAGFGSFPDARGYVLSSRSPDVLEVPTRATVKQVQIDWMGALPQTWGMPLPSAGPDVPIGAEIRLSTREPVVTVGGAQQRKWAIEGTLSHNLPGTLKDVHFVLVRGQVTGYPEAGSLLADASIVVQREWPAATPYQIDSLFDKGMNTKTSGSNALKEMLGTPSPGGFGVGFDEPMRQDEENRRMIAVSLHGMLDTMTRSESSGSNTNRVYRAMRRSTHSYDLSRWFTQPCLIVIGVLDDSELPVGLSVDGVGGEALRSRTREGSRSIVRWVYPLSPTPFAADANRGQVSEDELSNLTLPTDEKADKVKKKP